MKYQVMYDNGSRLRVRSGQWAFTKEEGYGLASLLLNQCFINEVYTSHRNGSILIYYDGNIENKIEPPLLVEDGDSQTKKIFFWKILLSRRPGEF